MAIHTIFDARTQSMKTLETNATTLGELKEALSSKLGIDTSGCSIQEGLTKTELLSDDTLLPTQVQFNGQVTDNLVFRISVVKGKIESGWYDESDGDEIDDLQRTLTRIENKQEEILALLKGEKIKESPYSVDEVNDMFNNL
jgi:hypothetical protein